VCAADLQDSRVRPGQAPVRARHGDSAMCSGFGVEARARTKKLVRHGGREFFLSRNSVTARIPPQSPVTSHCPRAGLLWHGGLPGVSATPFTGATREGQFAVQFKRRLRVLASCRKAPIKYASTPCHTSMPLGDVYAKSALDNHTGLKSQAIICALICVPSLQIPSAPATQHSMPWHSPRRFICLAGCRAL
jgi:hypothetical protein